MSTYKRLPVQFERGEGIWLWDTENRQYMDALSGIAVCGLGHAHPAVTQAIHVLPVFSGPDGIAHQYIAVYPDAHVHD